jgi:hypothetical protein
LDGNFLTTGSHFESDTEPVIRPIRQQKQQDWLHLAKAIVAFGAKMTWQQCVKTSVSGKTPRDPADQPESSTEADRSVEWAWQVSTAIRRGKGVGRGRFHDC